MVARALKLRTITWLDNVTTAVIVALPVVFILNCAAPWKKLAEDSSLPDGGAALPLPAEVSGVVARLLQL